MKRPGNQKQHLLMRILGIVTSRWMYFVVIALAIAAGRTRSHALLVALYVVTGTLTALLLLMSVPIFRNLRNTWRKYPDTPEYEEYARNRDAESAQDNKNKIEIK